MRAVSWMGLVGVLWGCSASEAQKTAPLRVVEVVRLASSEARETDEPLLEIGSQEDAAALAHVYADAISAQVDLDLARRTRARTETLHRESLASAEELERALAAVEAAEAANRSASAQVSRRNEGPGFNAVRAPFASTVGDVLTLAGDTAIPSIPEGASRCLANGG